LSPSEKTHLPEQKHDNQHDQPYRQRTNEERDHRQHQKDVTNLKEEINHRESVRLDPARDKQFPSALVRIRQLDAKTISEQKGRSELYWMFGREMFPTLGDPL
jgi:hypothetical protein